MDNQMMLDAVVSIKVLDPTPLLDNLANSRVLYQMLSQLMRGKALTILRRILEQNGCEAFRQLSYHFGDKDEIGEQSL